VKEGAGEEATEVTLTEEVTEEAMERVELIEAAAEGASEN
jgi:hypothetical protein